MSYGDWLIAQRVKELQFEDELARITARKLARQERGGRESKRSLPGRWLLCELGFRLVAAGAWLEAYALPRA